MAIPKVAGAKKSKKNKTSGVTVRRGGKILGAKKSKKSAKKSAKKGGGSTKKGGGRKRTKAHRLKSGWSPSEVG